MKKILICLAIAGVGLLNTGCNDWLDVLPVFNKPTPAIAKHINIFFILPCIRNSD